MSDLENTAPDGADVVVPETIEAEKVETVEGEENSESTTEEDAKPKKKDSVQKRINELTAEKWAEKREKEDLRRELESIKHQVFNQPNANQAPTLEAYGWDTEKYQEAVFRYAQEQSQREARTYYEQERQREAQYREQRQFEELLQEHGKREEAFAKATPDYHEQVDYLTRSMRFGREVVEVIGESDRSPEILYHLATNFDDAAKLSELPPHRAAAFVARLEAKLAPKQKPISRAPTPPTTLAGSSNARRDMTDPSLSDDEWFALRKSQSKK